MRLEIHNAELTQDYLCDHSWKMEQVGLLIWPCTAISTVYLSYSFTIYLLHLLSSPTNQERHPGEFTAQALSPGNESRRGLWCEWRRPLLG